MRHETSSRRRHALRHIITRPVFLTCFAQACLLLVALISLMVNMPSDSHVSTFRPATEAEDQHHSEERLQWELEQAMKHQAATNKTP